MQQPYVGEDVGFFSRPQLYGGFGGFPQDGKPRFVRSQRQKINAYAVCMCLVLPWLVFCGIYALRSFELHFTKAWVCNLITFLAACVLVLFTVWPIYRKVTLGEAKEPSWLMFALITSFVAWILGFVLGNLNYTTNLQPFYYYSGMSRYSHVDPATMRGEALMDAGQVFFTNDSALDLTRSMGFRNMDTYCVAPITVRNAGTTVPLATYDFWAVGLDCCSPNAADFHCGEFSNPNAHSGLRLLRDDQRPFFRLAVQQASAAYQIKVDHPLFVFWSSDATAEMESFRDEGYKYFLLGMLLQFGWQLLTVSLAVAAFSSFGTHRQL